MRSKLPSLLKRNFGALLLILVVSIIISKNYVPSTYLTGWDTLHPEFNFGVYWERIIKSVWQDHQGLGTVATQAHAAEIPRVILLQLLDIFLGVDQLRYSYAFLMLIIGPLGMYALFKFLTRDSFEDISREVGAICAGFIYLLNLSVLQHFYVPLEMFLTHFGFLSWLFLFAARFVKGGSKKDLLLFGIFSIFSAPQAHTATLFYTFVLAFVLFFGAHVFLSRETGKIKSFLVLLAVLLLTNSFWLLPNGYFIVKHGEDIQRSKIHQLFSGEAFLQNKSYGTFGDSILMRNYLFNWGEYIGENKFGDLLNEWSNHLENPAALMVGYGTFVLGLLGLLLAFLRKHNWAVSTLLLIGVSLFFIFNINPPLGFLYEWIQETIPLFGEAFRFPFNKFSTILSFGIALSAGFFLGHLSAFATHLGTKTKIMGNFLLVSITLASLVYYMYPAFKGNLISGSMKVDIPDRYFEMFEYFDSQEEYGRVADFPVHSLWGWTYHNWDEPESLGYQGAGFLWFGIKQPLLNREFDRWGLNNEQYYREMSHAVYSEDVDMFENILEKYDIRWLVLDESIIAPGLEEKILRTEEIEKLFQSSSKISLDKNFGEGLLVFSVQNPLSERISTTSGFTYAGPSYLREPYDTVYPSYGDFVSSGNADFPFVGVTTDYESVKNSVIRSGEGLIHFSLPAGFDLSSVKSVSERKMVEVFARKEVGGVQIFLRDLSESEDLQLPSLSSTGLLTFEINGEVYIVDEEKDFVTEKIGNLILEQGETIDFIRFDLASSVGINHYDLSPISNCSEVTANSSYSVEKASEGFTVSARRVRACLDYSLENAVKGVNEEEVLLLASVDSSGLGSTCFHSLDENKCLRFSQDFGEGRLVATMVGPTNSIDTTHILRVFADGSNNMNHVKVEYSDLSLSIYVPTEKTVIDGSALFNNEASSSYNLSFEKELELTPENLGVFGSTFICSTGNKEVSEDIVSVTTDGIRYSSDTSSVCDAYSYIPRSPSSGYVLEVESRNEEGLPLNLCFKNEKTSRCDLLTQLDDSIEFQTSYYFFPVAGVSNEYTIHISNPIFGNERATNSIRYVSVTPVPYYSIRGLHQPLQVAKEGNLVILSESYEDGWKAFCGLRECPAEHVLVNNWANGWVFENPDVAASVKLVFWPQLLQFIGYFLVLGTLFFLIIPIKNKD